MNDKRLLRMILMFMLPLFLGSCNQPTQKYSAQDNFDSDNQRNDDSAHVDGDSGLKKSKTRKIIISLVVSSKEDGSQESADRTIQPDFSTIASYTVSCVHEDGEMIPASELEPGESLEISLKSGNWTISAEGRLHNQRETASLQGSVNVTVPADQETPLFVSIPLSPVWEGEQGFFHFQVQYPEGKANSGTLRLSRIGGDGEAELYKTADLLQERNGVIPADPGAYLMEITLYGKHSHAGRVEVVHIYPFMETKAPEYIFSEDDFPAVLVFSDPAVMKDYMDLLPENEETNPYPVKFKNGNLSSKENAGATLRTICGSLSRYVDLDLRECQGEQYLSIASSNTANRAKIVTLKLPETIQVIEPNGFSGYSALTYLEAPGVETLGYGAFKECAKLASLDIPNLVTIEDAKNSGPGAFKDCVSLTSFDAPKLQYAGDSAFNNCDALVAVHFPELKSLGKSAFRYSDNLQTVDIPKTEFIGNTAFYNCAALQVVKLGPNPPALGGKTLFTQGTPLEGIQVPDEAVENYQNVEDVNWTAALKAKVRGLSQTEE